MIALRDSLGSGFIEEVRALFSKNGALARAKNFEYRPQQQEMAVAVARALEEERHLVVEAGTGIGKSIAYLAPAILYALQEKKKAVISTHTINLQEQLLYKDIPILNTLLSTANRLTIQWRLSENMSAGYRSGAAGKMAASRTQ